MPAFAAQGVRELQGRPQPAAEEDTIQPGLHAEQAEPGDEQHLTSIYNVPCSYCHSLRNIDDARAIHVRGIDVISPPLSEELQSTASHSRV
jgi:cytochrome c1